MTAIQNRVDMQRDRKACCNHICLYRHITQIHSTYSKK